MFRFSIMACILGAVSPLAAQDAVQTHRLSGDIVDAQTGKAVAARVYLHGEDGSWRFVASGSIKGSAVRYDKTNWISARSFEKHTTVSAHPFTIDLPAGRYTLLVERGKEYFPHKSEIVIGVKPMAARVELRRWVNMAKRGWYSGETHIHRTLEELPNVVLAEDLNVAFPLTYWVTHAFKPPTTGDKNIGGKIPDRLIQVDKTHVIWPRNTEYEIFTIGKKRHTLGAIFMLNHKSVFERGIPPVGPVAQLAGAEGALFDIDKPDWPFALTLLDSAKATLFELTNNHIWRTEFAFKNWVNETDGYLQPPRGGKKGDERDWLHYTLGVYYSLLDAGYRLVPSAGTANGVHPVPAGFGRVYVHLPDGFGYDKWVQGLRDGRSFVTTGPMLFAEIDGTQPGATLKVDPAAPKVKVQATVLSEHPLAFLEIVVNGEVVRTVMPQNKATAEGATQSSFIVDVTPTSSGWICVRGFEDRPDGRVRFAHTAPWWIAMPGKPLAPRAEEKAYLVRRVRDEIERSKDILPDEAMAEYRSALKRFEALPVREEVLSTARPATGEELRGWLEKMVWHHGYSVAEVRAATGLEAKAIEAALAKWNIRADNRPARPAGGPVRLLPYPGGRHPRIGFRDGAIDPQREAKVSVFAPWDDESYAVVDVPEAIWSNLGLTYLAHTHVPTIWDRDKVKLTPLEWKRDKDGTLRMERTLPNGIVYRSQVVAKKDGIEMELALTNGTKEKLTNLRAQVCVMLQGMTGFHAQTATNKVLRGPVVACRDSTGARWILTGWQPLHRSWHNPPVPCLHADPSFPDCAPGDTVRARGILAFYEGKDVEGAMERLQEALKIR